MSLAQVAGLQGRDRAYKLHLDMTKETFTSCLEAASRWRLHGSDVTPNKL